MMPPIRKARKSDMDYVRCAWSQCAFAMQRDGPADYTLWRPLFEAVQDRLMSTATVLVAVNPEDDDHLLGCVVFQPADKPVLHFVTVKVAVQRKGLATALLEAAGICPNKPAVHTLDIPMRLVRGKSKTAAAARRAWTYVPFGLMP